MCIGPCIVVIIEEYEPNRCYLFFYYAYDRLNMFWALLRPSSGAEDCSADYHIGRPVLGLLLVVGYSLHPGHLSSLPAPKFQPTATQTRGRPMW